jgi:hypothetical protein
MKDLEQLDMVLQRLATAAADDNKRLRIGGACKTEPRGALTGVAPVC